MFRSVRLILCVFLTSAFNSAWADYCFDNANQNGVMARTICFKDITILNFGSAKQKLYLRSADVDEAFSIQKWDKSNSGFLLSAQGEYLNYVENCGIEIFSNYQLKAIFNPQGQYVHDKSNSLIITYKYTPNRCQTPSGNGTEHFIPKI